MENPIVTRDGDDDYYYDNDPELARNRSKLRVLFHAATCPCDGLSDCPSGVVHCCASKRVFAHIITCTAGHECDVPGCKNSRRVWRHYRNCSGHSQKPGEARASTKNCALCSVVPVPHDASILCDRFRTPRRLILRRGSFSSDAASVSVTSTEVAAGYETNNSYDRLPVWRKRNLMHAQQQQQQQQQLYAQQQQQKQQQQKQKQKQKQHSPMQEKENAMASNYAQRSTVTKTNTAIGTKCSRSFSLDSSEQSSEQPLRREHGSHSNSQHAAVNSTHNIHPIRSSRFLQEENNDFAPIVKTASSSSSGPIQLPAHPRDAKRRPVGAPRPIPRRSSQQATRMYALV